MAACQRCLFLITPNFIESKYLQLELSHALMRQNELGLVYVVPIHRLSPTFTFESLPYELSNIQGIDGTDLKSQQFWDKLITAIKSMFIHLSKLIENLLIP